MKRPLPPAIAAQVRARLKNSDPVRAPVPRRGRMNRTEAEYAGMLEIRKRAGDVAWWGFESMRFRLADGAWFCPDFTVVLSSGSIELHEVKGHWREAARLRIKLVAEMYPFRVVAIQKNGGGWSTEEFS